MKLIKFISLIAIIVLISLFISCASKTHPLDEHRESYNHMTSALEHELEFIKWMNTLTNAPTSKRPSQDEWLEKLSLLEIAISEAKSVDPEFLDLLVPNMRNKWEDLYIPSMEGIHYYYATSIIYPEEITKLNNTRFLQKSMSLNDSWSDWYGLNRQKILNELNSDR